MQVGDEQDFGLGGETPDVELLIGQDLVDLDQVLASFRLEISGTRRRGLHPEARASSFPAHLGFLGRALKA